MFDLIKKTRDSGLEHGFAICKTDAGLVMSGDGICEGSECGVEVPRCEWRKTFLDFHTHPPSGALLMSPQDIHRVLIDEADFVCIGNVMSKRAKEGAVRCYEYNKNVDVVAPIVRDFDHQINLPANLCHL